MIDPVFFFFLHFHFHFHFCSTLVFRMPIVLLKDFYLLQRVAQLKHSYVAIYCCCPIVAACARARILDQNPRIDAVKIKTKKKQNSANSRQTCNHRKRNSFVSSQFLISKSTQPTFSSATNFFDTIERLLKFALIL